MNAPWAVEYFEIVVKDHIPSLPKTMRLRIKKAIEERLTSDPVGYGKPLQHTLKGHRRIRVGDYRLVYRIDESRHAVSIASDVPIFSYRAACCSVGVPVKPCTSSDDVPCSHDRVTDPTPSIHADTLTPSPAAKDGRRFS